MITSTVNLDLGVLLDSSHGAAAFETQLGLSVVPNPQTGLDEHWLGVQFASKYDGEGMARHGRAPISLMMVLDISGSMSSAATVTNDDGDKVARECLPLPHCRPALSLAPPPSPSSRHRPLLVSFELNQLRLCCRWVEPARHCQARLLYLRRGPRRLRLPLHRGLLQQRAAAHRVEGLLARMERSLMVLARGVVLSGESEVVAKA